MSQPPQPPNEGFGAPQDPPPGGFGAPQEPGYGYPQTPAAGQPATPQPPAGAPATPPPPAGPPSSPPPGRPGYGYPQQQPPGQVYPTPAPGQQVGYGQQPGQQPYGAPQQPYGGYQQPGTVPMGGMPGGGGSGGRKKISAQAMIIIAAVVAIALIIGGGIFIAAQDDGEGGKKDESKQGQTDGGTKGGDGEDGPQGGAGVGKEKKPAGQSQALFNVPSPEVKGDSSVTVKGSWLTEKTYAKSGMYEVSGYQPDTGKKLWTIPLDGEICAASEHISPDGITAVLAKSGKPSAKDKYPSCTEIVAIDVDNGRKLWQENAKPVDEELRFSQVTVGGNLVAAGGTSGGAAWDIKTGGLKWEPRAGDKCKDQGYGGGKILVAITRCGTDFREAPRKVQPLDDNGKPISSYTLPSGIQWAHIPSTDPLVVAVDSTDQHKGPTDYFAIDAKTGKLRSKVAVDPSEIMSRCDATNVEPCRQMAVGNDRLYLATREHEGGSKSSRTNEIIAYDLTTGKPTGQKADAGDRYSIFPLRMDGENIIAYKHPPYDKGGQVVSIDGKSFKQTVFLENPADESVRDAETSFSTLHAEYLYGNGRLFIADVYASRSRSTTRKDYLIVALGVK
ncbi:PQQ-binding-like beta-propeller repeat protein [Streptomyces sp. KLOTTS4A1]|uniref:outer membrane protein assembly factor BamB family protein n=1 Tax=Streptomyces sp. KLOTTS4A1 TaxID=3390996 RepID=UPI0039F4A0F4